jgi:hypothetical protein
MKLSMLTRLLTMTGVAGLYLNGPVVEADNCAGTDYICTLHWYGSDCDSVNECGGEAVPVWDSCEDFWGEEYCDVGNLCCFTDS